MNRYVMNEEKADVLERLGFEFENKFSVPIWTKRDVVYKGKLGYFEIAYPDYELRFIEDEIPYYMIRHDATAVIAALRILGAIKEVKIKKEKMMSAVPTS